MVMIKIKIRGPSTLSGALNACEKEYPFGRKCLWIGRGDEINEKESEDSHILNLEDISKSVSRIHACLIISPAFLSGFQSTYPSYFKKLNGHWPYLPENILFQIWQFIRPARKIFLKDMHSKTGLYKKANKIKVYTGLQVILGDTKPLVFQHQQFYDTNEQMNNRVEYLKQKDFIVLNECSYSEADSFWIFTFKNRQYIIKNHPSKLEIGRSSNCHLVICEASISRKHATLQCKNGEWKILDGDGINSSSNGIWQRVKKLAIDYRSKGQVMMGGESVAKIGDILLNFEIKQDYSYINISEMCNSISFKNSTNESFNGFLKKELVDENSPIFSKKSSCI